MNTGKIRILKPACTHLRTPGSVAVQMSKDQLLSTLNGVEVSGDTVVVYFHGPDMPDLCDEPVELFVCARRVGDERDAGTRLEAESCQERSDAGSAEQYARRSDETDKKGRLW